MDRLLHRGIYRQRTANRDPVKPHSTWVNGGKNSRWKLYPRRQDSACSVFIWSFGYGFWAASCWSSSEFSPWPDLWWGHYFYFKNILIPLLVAIITTVWFSIGGTLDLIKMFKTLDAHEADEQDDGRVVGHLSASDLAHFAEVEKKRQEQNKK